MLSWDQDLGHQVSRPRPRFTFESHLIVFDSRQNELECTRVSRPRSRDHNTDTLTLPTHFQGVETLIPGIYAAVEMSTLRRDLLRQSGSDQVLPSDTFSGRICQSWRPSSCTSFPALLMKIVHRFQVRLFGWHNNDYHPHGTVYPRHYDLSILMWNSANSWNHVCSSQRLIADQSLTLYCAVRHILIMYNGAL